MFCVALLLVSIALVRLSSFPPDVAFNLMVLAFLGLVFALALAVLSIIQIWKRALGGIGTTLATTSLCVAILIIPLFYASKLMFLPQVNDISTDIETPPKFHKLAALHLSTGGDADQYQNNQVAELESVYSDINTMSLERSAASGFDLVSAISDKMSWEIISKFPPDMSSGSAGFIEAVDRTAIMGFADDIALRIGGGEDITIIDMRSASRYGSHDFGRNAARIRDFFHEIKRHMVHSERRKIEQDALRRVIARNDAARKRRHKEALARAAKRKELEEELLPIFSAPAAQGEVLPPPVAANENKEKNKRLKKRKPRKTWNPWRNAIPGAG
jgi:hypothetical protein